VKGHVFFDKGVTKWWKGVLKQMNYKTLQNKFIMKQNTNITKHFLNKNKTTHYEMQNKTKMSPNLLNKML
jgi:hypothetical protein